ncbi:hypothetical protein GCM10009809_42040 [Isoptericola hypogeus]|uniref:Uncharacterized protein n=1 Tax=Isoptericola hypogeus TaxID=300179 RepID=A0ABP4W1K9_9MICO
MSDRRIVAVGLVGLTLWGTQLEHSQPWWWRGLALVAIGCTAWIISGPLIRTGRAAANDREDDQ